MATTGPSRGSGASCLGVHFAMAPAYGPVHGGQKETPERAGTGSGAERMRGLRAEMAFSGFICSY
ncbi:hypothetical protein CF54_33095 [Streptomyces sp. Tu 6176]|nr:hypothetical protein CF54_33095 [Streptomyces sp. Tu 6176]